MTTHDDLLLLAERQHGLIAVSQARAEGLSYSGAYRLRAARTWEPITHDVLRRVGSRRTAEQQAMAAVLDAGGDAALSHVPGAALWGVRGCLLRPCAITTTKSSLRRTELAATHVVRSLPPHWRTVHRDIPVVRPELLALQLFAVCHEERAERFVERLWPLGTLSGGSIGTFLDDMGARGRNGTAALRRYLEPRGPDYTPTASGLETRVMQLLRRVEVPVRRQINAGGEHWTGRVDFVHLGLPLIIEVQSEAYHSSLIEQEDDAIRIAALEADGFIVVEVTDTDAWSRPQVLLDKTRASLARLATTPT